MRKAELESALSLQTTTEKTSEKAEHLLRASYWEQKTLLNEEYSMYDIVRLLAEYGVRNSLYEYECKQYFFRTGKKAKADFILKHVLLDWLHERALNQTEATEALKTAESESSDEESANKVQKVMDAITAVNYEPKATREILKAQTENFQHAMLHIMHKGLGSVFDEYLRISELTLCVKGIEETETRQEYIKNAVTSIETGRMNIEYCRQNEGFREYLPMHEERQKYYEVWLEYLENYEVSKKLSA